MSKRKVEFLRFFNDYPMIAFFTLDKVAVTVISFLVVFMILTIGAVALPIIIFTSLTVSAGLTFFYIKAKEETSKGFLKHWLFSNGIYKLKKDEKKWKELQNADNKDYFPTPQDKFYVD